MQEVDSSNQISAVVVVRNGERFLAQTLQRIMEQTRRPNELIVVDGQSSDRTAEIARAFPGVQYYLQPELGIAIARNLAIDIATGEYVAFSDADDLWTPEKLSVQLNYMVSHPQLMYTTTWLQLFYEPAEIYPSLSQHVNHIAGLTAMHQLQPDNITTPPSYS